ncbi:hypothetical protein B6N60_01730 [Richelia sinica FACHB-800]|uniref:DUF5331 domain-containing protein n=1 Tax=Richelia sinica FACHB-800 TaxID=1357546 RepID=A0A975Y4C4_9NOST|nr:DUF5331 domain-containing protein [Richelia sinica]MBD2666890.1 hypothetical protein [Richelia sinica FACHB-800]QXE23041.1 hypothetical protein B6N60_01730 [Richelia sinica FACHB-800]
MDIQQLRPRLKMQWLSYYEENRSWLAKMRVWHTYEGVRRPSSGYILATLSVLENQFDDILAFILELNNNPDEIVAALGLNFNPEEELHLLSSQDCVLENQIQGQNQSQIISSFNNSYEQQEEQPNIVGNIETSEEQEIHTLSNVPVFPRRMLIAEKSVNSVVKETKVYPLVKTKSNYQNLSQLYIPISYVSQSVTNCPINIGNQLKESKINQPLTNTSIRLNNAPQSNGLQVKKEVNNFCPETKIIPHQPELISPANHPRESTFAPQTNARSLASWIDEFCQGVKWVIDEAVARKL